MLNISFGKISHFKDYDRNLDWNDDDENDVSAIVRDKIRENLMSGCYIPQYADQSTIKELHLKAARNAYWEKPAQTQTSEEGVRVNYAKLKEIGSAYSHIKIPNKLYSGAALIYHPKYEEAMEKIKESGIKTIIALEGTPRDSYYELANKNGINEICLQDIGNHFLNVLSIIPTKYNGKTLYNLVNDPDYWVTQNQDGSIIKGAAKDVLDLQEFIDIMNGEHEDLPYPIYYGCTYGSNRTYAWTAIYNILKNADRTKPLEGDTIKKLIEFYDIMKETYRYS